MSSETSISRAGPGSNQKDLALHSLRNIVEKAPAWSKWLDTIIGKIEVCDGPSSQPGLSQNRGSTKSLKVEGGTQAHRAASVADDGSRPPLSDVDVLLRPIDQQSQSPSGVPFQQRRDEVLAVQTRVDAVVGDTASATGDKVVEHRIHNSVTVYYDSHMQSFLEGLVKFVLASGGIFRKAKRAATLARIRQEAVRRTESDDKWVRRTESDDKCKWEKCLGSIQSGCELVAHKLLQGEAYVADMKGIRQGLQDAQDLASEEVGRMEREGSQVTGSIRPQEDGQQAQTTSPGTDGPTTGAGVRNRVGLGWQQPNPLLITGDAVYYIGKKIAEGSFGVVFEGTRTEKSSGSRQVAIKFEPRKTDKPQLHGEYRAYIRLEGCPGVSNVYYFGQLYFHRILVLDLLGPSLEDLFDRCARRSNIKTVAKLAKQMLSVVQGVHGRDLIYRDIKPDNFLMDGSIVFLVDFGLAKDYRDPTTKEHIPYREDKSLCGTARYVSINTHLKKEQSRRDDLEALGHVFMYFLRGGLPWQGIKGVSTDRKYEIIGEVKQATSIEKLCRGFPVQFETYLTYVRGLGFKDTPDYEYLRELFTVVLRDVGGLEDGEYDWTKVGKGKPQGSASREAAAKSSQPTKSQLGKRARTDSFPTLGQNEFQIRRRSPGLDAPSAGLPAKAESSAVEADRYFGCGGQNWLLQVEQDTDIRRYAMLRKPPPMDKAWLEYEQDAGPRPTYSSIFDKQSRYAKDCRDLHIKTMAPGMRDFHLSEGVTTLKFTVPSERDGFLIPVHQYRLVSGDSSGELNETVVIYYHGGGLMVGEADSEALSCRRILKESGENLTVYSVGYRLMPQVEAAVCLSDSLDAFNHLHQLHRLAKIIVVGSSSGGQLAALVSQAVRPGTIAGVVLRCPVTSDAFSGPQYVPERLRPFHTTAWNKDFETGLLGSMKRKIPRDGLERMPLEAGRDDLRGQPRHYIQVCTNDMLFSDGFCYYLALKEAGVEVQLDVMDGWPHTFWLVAPHLEQALEAERAMLKWLPWVRG